jgi:hypothetical protein
MRGIVGRAAALLLVGALAVTACGDAGTGVSPGAARALHGAVQLVRAAAVARDRDAATAAVDHLERTLATLRADGRVSSEAGARIERAIARVRASLASLPTTTTTTTTTRPPEPSGQGGTHDHGRGHRNGHDD